MTGRTAFAVSLSRKPWALFNWAMRATKFAAVAGCLAAGAIALNLAAPASADYDTVGYLHALDQAGLIGPNVRSQYTDSGAALHTGMYFCQQVQQGKSPEAIVFRGSGDGYPSLTTGNMMVIYAAATTYLC
ncbi:hypothetical protein NGTWS0302_23930 [Mycolicibacterium cyprinidarum]|uniref:DUF732 domain-containing protein n=1 Tax=Mycolicibacterium cyprinidarum TaxID=2860311 RepID=A0ABQ4VCE9_9MYCO|nr:hypothetical protein NGTWS0302_23930 [Mycolicibacterium sp. NGTWS0302]GJF19540.1 hypothetical protein NGTWS1702_28250 [Mycolicibacterium sp. NGTWSNA01]